MGYLTSEYPSVEADELVTKDHLRAELALTRGDLRAEMADLRTALGGEMAGLRVEMADGFRRQQAFLLGAIAAATAVLGTLTSVL